MREVEMRKYIYILALLVLLVGTGACTKQSVMGNMIGVVVRGETPEGVPKPVPNPVLAIRPGGGYAIGYDNRVFIYGDSGGRYSTNLPEGKYYVSIGLKKGGPYYIWPDPVVLQGNKTLIMNFTIPEDLN
jgi:hypothetical protein